MDLKGLLESTADGAFAVDQRLKIVYWNQAAHDMLGFDASDVIGRPCYEVLAGLDEDNRPFCKAFCGVSEAVAKHEAVASNEIQALTSRGDRRWLNMSVVSTRQGPEEDDVLMLHLFRDSARRSDFEALFNKVLASALDRDGLQRPVPGSDETAPPFNALTPRESEVLGLLAEGAGTREIARRLVISPNTVRNHIQHVLQKLNVHSRAEAVASAIRRGFIQ